MKENILIIPSSNDLIFTICARIKTEYEFSVNCVLMVLLYIGLWFSVISRKEVWYRFLEGWIWYHPSDYIRKLCIPWWIDDWIWFSYTECWRFRWVMIQTKSNQIYPEYYFIYMFVCYINRYLRYWCRWCWCRFVKLFHLPSSSLFLWPT